MSTGKKLPQFGSKDKCARCGQTVYVIEKVVVEGKTTRIFHNYCLRCSKCDKVVTLGNYVSLDDQIYCKPHYNTEMQERRVKGPIIIVNKKEGDSQPQKNAPVVKKLNKQVSDVSESEEENHQPQPSKKEEVVHEEVVEELSELSE
jgi:hypothetical protein